MKPVEDSVRRIIDSKRALVFYCYCWWSWVLPNILYFYIYCMLSTIKSADAPFVWLSIKVVFNVSSNSCSSSFILMLRFQSQFMSCINVCRNIIYLVSNKKWHFRIECLELQTTQYQTVECWYNRAAQTGVNQTQKVGLKRFLLR